MFQEKKIGGLFIAAVLCHIADRPPALLPPLALQQGGIVAHKPEAEKEAVGLWRPVDNGRPGLIQPAAKEVLQDGGVFDP